jgi:hypothetical protein
MKILESQLRDRGPKIDFQLREKTLHGVLLATSKEVASHVRNFVSAASEPVVHSQTRAVVEMYNTLLPRLTQS